MASCPGFALADFPKDDNARHFNGDYIKTDETVNNHSSFAIYPWERYSHSTVAHC